MAEIEHFLDPGLKYKEYEKFTGDVENVQVNIFDEKAQLNSLAPIKMRLRDAVKAVLFFIISLMNYHIKLNNLFLLKNIIKSETVAYYISRVFSFVKHCGLDENLIRFRQHLKNEMAHYANECWDLGLRYILINKSYS